MHDVEANKVMIKLKSKLIELNWIYLPTKKCNNTIKISYCYTAIVKVQDNRENAPLNEYSSRASPAAVVRTSYCSYGKGHILHLSRAETTIPINTKVLTINFIVEMRWNTKCGWDWFHGGVSPFGWNLQFLAVFSSCFVDQAVIGNHISNWPNTNITNQ